MDREKELWAIALWVEKHYGDDGLLFLAQRIQQNQNAGEDGGVALWAEIAERFMQLRPDVDEPD